MSTRIVREATAIYAALDDKEALRRGPIFIEKDGQTEAVLLSVERYRQLTGQTDFELWVEQQLAPLQPEIEAYQRMLSDLLKEHRGEWVAIHQGQIVALSPDKSVVVRHVIENHLQLAYIERIQEEPRVVDFPHLERSPHD